MLNIKETNLIFATYFVLILLVNTACVSSKQENNESRIAVAIQDYRNMASVFIVRPSDFDGYDEILRSLMFGPSCNHPEDGREFPYPFEKSRQRVRAEGSVPSDMKSLEYAYQEVLRLEHYFLGHSRDFEKAGLGNDDVVLLEKSGSVGRLQAILEERQKNGESPEKDMVEISRKLGYSLTGLLWYPKKFDRYLLLDKEFYTPALAHWINGE